LQFEYINNIKIKLKIEQQIRIEFFKAYKSSTLPPVIGQSRQQTIAIEMRSQIAILIL